MKYLLMCCIEEARWERIPEPERDEIMRDYGAWVESLEGTGAGVPAKDVPRRLVQAESMLERGHGPPSRVEEPAPFSAQSSPKRSR